MSGSKALAAPLLVVLAGCTVGPDYHKPGIDAPQAWHQSLTPDRAHPTLAQADPQWWRIFHDPIFTDLERDVASANLDLREATLRLGESEAERRIADAAQMPRLEGNASYARERASTNGVLGLLGSVEREEAQSIAAGTPGLGPAGLPGAVGNPGFNLPQFGMNASWEVDLWGHVRRQVEAANAAVRATEDMRRDVLVSLMAQTAQDYVDLRGVQARLAVLDRNIGIAKESVRLTTLRFEQGAATKLDVADSTGQLHSFESQRPVLETRQVHLLNALSFLLPGRPAR